MAPKTQEQFEEIRQGKRELILQVALEIFAVHGYHGTSISMIAKKAGIAKGLLYNYFESKEKLLKSVIEEGLNSILGEYTPLIEKNFPEEKLTPVFFKGLYAQIFKSMRENIDFWRLYFALILQPGVMEMIIKDYEGMMFTQLELLEKYYKSQGSKKPRADALHATVLIDGITMNFIQPHTEFTMEELEEMVINGLEKPIF